MARLPASARLKRVAARLPEVELSPSTSLPVRIRASPWNPPPSPVMTTGPGPVLMNFPRPRIGPPSISGYSDRLVISASEARVSGVSNTFAGLPGSCASDAGAAGPESRVRPPLRRAAIENTPPALRAPRLRVPRVTGVSSSMVASPASALAKVAVAPAPLGWPPPLQLPAAPNGWRPGVARVHWAVGMGFVSISCSGPAWQLP